MSANPNGLTTLQGDLASFKANTAAQLAAVNSELSSLAKQSAQAQQDAWIGSALAASIVNIAPQDGKTNRFGMNMATVQGQGALSFSYTHVNGATDFNAGVAFSTKSTRYALARVGVGFSW